MNSIFTIESIRAQIEAFLSGELSRFVFETWLWPLVDMDIEEGQEDMHHLGRYSMLILFEMSGGYTDYDEACDLLRPLLTTIPQKEPATP